MKKIVLIGAESTGKTWLAEKLAQHYKTQWIPEFAREYILNLSRPYCYDDLIKIAKTQIDEAKLSESNINKMIFFDTDLIITKIWFLVVYNRVPDWLDAAITENKPELYLFCDNDIPWTADLVRENGGKNREKLKKLYINELIRFNFQFKIVTGIGINRLQCAIETLNNLKQFNR